MACAGRARHRVRRVGWRLIDLDAAADLDAEVVRGGQRRARPLPASQYQSAASSFFISAICAVWLVVMFFASVIASALLPVELFTPLGLVPHQRRAAVLESTISWNYTTWLNIVFLAIATALVFWFYRSGSGPMLRMMGGSPVTEHAHHDHGQPNGHTEVEATESEVAGHGEHGRSSTSATEP